MNEISATRSEPWRLAMLEDGILDIEEIRLVGRVTYLVVTWFKDGSAQTQLARDKAGDRRLIGNPVMHRVANRRYIVRLAERILKY